MNDPVRSIPLSSKEGRTFISFVFELRTFPSIIKEWEKPTSPDDSNWHSMATSCGGELSCLWSLPMVDTFDSLSRVNTTQRMFSLARTLLHLRKNNNDDEREKTIVINHWTSSTMEFNDSPTQTSLRWNNRSDRTVSSSSSFQIHFLLASKCSNASLRRHVGDRGRCRMFVNEHGDLMTSLQRGEWICGKDHRRCSVAKEKNVGRQRRLTWRRKALENCSRSIFSPREREKICQLWMDSRRWWRHWWFTNRMIIFISCTIA